MTETDPNALAGPLRAGYRFLELIEIVEGRHRITLVSGRRSIERQIELRRAHCGPSHYDIYDKPSGECSPPTARPGRSKHQQGLAMDLGGDKEWAAAVLGPLGFHRPVRGEDWHFEFQGDPGALPRDMAEALRQHVLRQGPSGAIAAVIRLQQAGLSIDIDENGSVSVGSITGFIGDAATGVVAAGGAAVGAVTSPLDALGSLLSFFTDLNNWRRLGLILAGSAAVIIALAILGRVSPSAIRKALP